MSRDITLEDTIYIRFTTRAFATGIPTTLAGSPVLSAYEENNLTQITAGVSITVDYDSVTGLNQVTIVATAANGYENSKSYDLVITTGTVSGVSVVGEVVGSFTIGSSAAAVDLANGADGLGAIKTVADTILVDTGTTLEDHLTDIKGTSFVKDTHSLIDIEAYVDILDDGTSGNVKIALDAAAILVATGTTIPATITTVQNDLDIITDTDGVILGDAGVNKILDEVNTGGTHNVNDSIAKQIRQAATTGLYAGQQVWIDTSVGGNGTSGTDPDENGTQDNPSDNIADATTIAIGKGIKRFNISPGSAFTLIENYANYIFLGDNGVTIAMGGKTLTGSVFRGLTVTGEAVSATSMTFDKCHMGTSALTCTLPTCHIHQGTIENDITANATGSYVFDRCHSGIAGTATFDFNFGAAIGNTNLNMRAHSGGVNLEAMGDTGTDVASIEGWGQILEGTCTGGTVSIRGNFTRGTFTNLTPDEGARVAADTINAQVDAALVTYGLDHLVFTSVVGADVADNSIIARLVSKSATADWDSFNHTTESLEAIRDNTGTGGAGLTVTVSALTSAAVIDIWSTHALTEAYATDGAEGTPAQLLYMLWSDNSEFAFVGTTKTSNKLDGTTASMTHTLDDADLPTSKTRAT